MRTLLFHCKNYRVKLGKLADRPKGIVPERVVEKEQHCEDCIVALITVEWQDNVETIPSTFADEISKMCKEVQNNTIVLLPFAHLSNNLAPYAQGIQIISSIEEILKTEFTVYRAHFGSHKELLLDVYGHPWNARYREF